MKRHKIVILIIVLLAGLIVAAAIVMSGRSEPVASLRITSADGMATLEVSEGALPEGLSADDISIRKIAIEDVGVGLEKGEDDAVAYRLEPSGTVFSKPAAFRLTRVMNKDMEGALPAAFLVSGDNRELEIIDGVSVDKYLSRQAEAVTVPVAHFSDLVIFNTVIGSVNIRTPGATPVGEIVHAVASVDLREFYLKHAMTYVDDASGTLSSSGVLSPSGPVEDRPESSLLPFEVRGEDFTCAEEGQGEINWELAFRSRVRYMRAMTIDGKIFDDIAEAGDHGTIMDRWEATKDVITKANYSITVTCGEGMVRICPPVTMICEGSNKSFSGYYECDPATGEQVGDVLLDIETGEPIDAACP